MKLKIKIEEIEIENLDLKNQIEKYSQNKNKLYSNLSKQFKTYKKLNKISLFILWYIFSKIFLDYKLIKFNYSNLLNKKLFENGY